MRQRMHHPKTDGVLDQGGKRRKKKIANVWPTKSRMSKIRKIFMHTVLEKFQSVLQRDVGHRRRSLVLLPGFP